MKINSFVWILTVSIVLNIQFCDFIQVYEIFQVTIFFFFLSFATDLREKKDTPETPIYVLL